MRDDHASRLIALGRVQLAIGILCINLNIVLLTSRHAFSPLSPIGHGIWSGAVYIITGAFGIAAGKQGSRWHVITFNILSIIAACFSALLLGIAILSAEISQHRLGAVVLESLLAFLGLVEGIVAIVSSAVCCMIGVCCCDSNGCCCCCCPPSTESDQVEAIDFTKCDNDLGQYTVVVPNSNQGIDQMQSVASSNQHKMVRFLAPLLRGVLSIRAENSEPPPGYDYPNVNYTKLNPDDS